MTVAATIVNDALAILNLYSDVLPADPAHQQRGFTTLVGMLHRMRGDGMRIVNQIPPTTLSDLKEPSWATDGLRFELAKALAPFLRATMTMEAEAARVVAANTLMRKAAPPIACSLPGTLPKGGGNWNWESERFYAEVLDADYDIYGHQYVNESATFYADFDYDADSRSTTVSSVTWSNQGGVSATISGSALSGNLASSVLTFPTIGSVLVLAKATYANAQVKNYLFRIEVTDVA